MTQETLSTHVQTAREALHTLLTTLTMNEGLTLDASAPEREAPGAPLEEDLAARFVLHDAEQGPVVALAPAWVPFLSEAMLGEALAADAPDAADLMQEVAAQGFGSVQTALAAEGLELDAPAFAAAAPGQDVPLPDGGAFWRVPFSATHEETALDGFALLPAVPKAEATPDAQQARSPQQASSEPSSPSQATPSQQSAPASTQESPEVDVAAATFADLGAEDLNGDGGGSGNFELLAEVNLEVTVELGRRRLPLADVLKLTPGSVVELEKLVGEPLSVYANGRFIAEGEAVVIDEQFGVRITSLASKRQRDKAFL